MRVRISEIRPLLEEPFTDALTFLNLSFRTNFQNPHSSRPPGPTNLKSQSKYMQHFGNYVTITVFRIKILLFLSAAYGRLLLSIKIIPLKIPQSYRIFTS
jgi:hypothetical protein